MMGAHYARRREAAGAVREANLHRVCEVCGSTFAAPRRDTRYCSSRCRQKAYRRRAAPGEP
jgi:predicted nucleic acid-binding Zn ribbon protein